MLLHLLLSEGGQLVQHPPSHNFRLSFTLADLWGKITLITEETRRVETARSAVDCEPIAVYEYGERVIPARYAS